MYLKLMCQPHTATGAEGLEVPAIIQVSVNTANKLEFRQSGKGNNAC